MNFEGDYFHWLLGFFKLFGLYPPKEYKWRIVYYIFSLPHVTLTLVSILLELLNVLLNQETFSRKMLNVGVLTMHIAAGMRLLGWLWTRDKLEEVVDVIRRPSFKFTIFMYDGSRKINKHERAPIDGLKDTRLHYTNAVCCSIYLVVSCYILFHILITYACNLFNESHEEFDPHLNKTVVYRDFPYPMWFPFDISLSDGHYFLAFFYQPYAYCNLMLSFWCVDWLVLSSVVHLQTQLTVVSMALEEVDKNTAKISGGEFFLVKKMRLTKCVQELNEIFRAAKLIEGLTNRQLLVQNGLATFIFCTLLYVNTTLTVSVEIYFISTATGIILLEPFVQCWICQNFTMEFSKVLEKIYELNWVEYPPSLRKFLVITMVRLQKPGYITLGKWRIIDISFYIQLLKTAYSFYTLISQQTKNK